MLHLTRIALLGASLAAVGAAQNTPGSSNPSHFTSTGQFLSPVPSLFAADDQTHGKELHCLHHGSSISCTMIDVNPGPGASNPRDIVPFGNGYVFVANDGTHGVEVMQTDCTAVGTTLVADINTTGDSNPHQLTVVGSRVFFSASDAGGDEELYAYDGTTVTLIKNIHPLASSIPLHLTAFGNSLLFTCDDGINGREPWISDGTTLGTTLLHDIYPGHSGSGSNGFSEVNGKVVFSAISPLFGREPWVTDGVTTNLLKDIETTSMVGSRPQGFHTAFLPPISGVFFSATKSGFGTELWRTDGTTAGTVMVANLGFGSLGSNPRDIESSLFEVWFVADNGLSGPQIWKTDVLGAPPTPVTTGNIAPRDLCSVGVGHGVVFTDDANSGNLWITSNAPGGATSLATFRHGPGNLIKNLNHWQRAYGLRVMFTAADALGGLELWTTDGTAQGTKITCDIAPNPGPGGIPADLRTHTATLGSTIDIDIEGGPPSGIGVVAFANNAGPPIPGALIGFNGTINISSIIATLATPLDAAGAGTVNLAIPVIPGPLNVQLALQGVMFDLTGGANPTMTPNSSIAMEIGTVAGITAIVGTFDDKDHRYEISIEGSPTSEGDFELWQKLINGDSVRVKRLTTNPAGSYFFSGHTPLDDIDFLELRYDDKNGPVVIWRSYC